jgi:hypothetical protein
MSKLNSDGNLLGRVGAVVLIAAAGFGLHRLNCSTGAMCPVMKTESCCSFKAIQAEAAKTTPSPAK